MKRIIFLIIVFLFVFVLANINLVHAQSSNPFNANIHIYKEIVSQISPYIWGVNGEALPDVTADEFLARYPAYRTMGIKMIRYPGGCFAEGFDLEQHNATFLGRDGSIITQPIMSIDEVLKLANILNAKILFVIDIGNTDGYRMGCLNKYQYPDNWQKNIEFFRKYKGQIKYYELGNEPFFWNRVTAPTSFPVEKYLVLAEKYAQTLKEIDPSIKTTLVSYPSYENGLRSAISSVCANNLPCFDTVSVHPYYRSGYDPAQPISDNNYPGKAAFAVSNVIVPYFNHLNTFYQLTSFQPDKSLAITEYNLQCYGYGISNYPPSTGTVDHGFYMIEQLFQMITNNVTIANYHDMIHTQLPYRTGNCGMLEEDHTTITPAALTFMLSSPAAGGRLLRTENNSLLFTIPQGSYPGAVPNVSVSYLSAYTVISPNDGLLYVFLINKHNTNDAVANLQFDPSIEGLASANTADVTRLNSNSFTDRLFSKASSTVAFSNPIAVTVPAHSIVLVKIYNSTPGPFSCNRCSIIHGCERTQFQSATSACLSPNSGVIRTTDCSCPQINSGDNNRCTSDCTSASNLGDFNHDGKVDIFDLRQLLSSFTSISDYNVLVGNFGR